MTRRRSVVMALALWMLLAFVVWNVVFDRMIVLAGRRYVHDAYELYHGTGQYLLIDDVMKPAVAHAATTASMVGGAIALVGAALVWAAAGHERRRKRGR